MPRYAPNRVPTAVKKRYFELLHKGYRGAAAARQVGVSTRVRLQTDLAQSRNEARLTAAS